MTKAITGIGGAIALVAFFLISGVVRQEMSFAECGPGGHAPLNLTAIFFAGLGMTTCTRGDASTQVAPSDSEAAAVQSQTESSDAEPAGTFHGYACTGGCVGHRAGFRWAQVRGITDPDQCPLNPRNSHSFTEGCWAEAGRNGP